MMQTHKQPPPPPARRRAATVGETMLEQLWFGEDDDERARREASESVAAAMAISTGLKPFPVFAAKAMALLSNPGFDVRAVRELIERDQAIAAKVFRTAQSAAFKPKAPLNHVGEVITRLGSREVQAIIASVATMELFGDATGFGAVVRDHGAAVASLARTLARGRPCAADAFLCGLMHDIGKLMIIQTGGAPYGAAHLPVLETPDACHAIEREVLSYDHALLGAFVLGEWGFSAPLTTVVAMHHQPLRTTSLGDQVDELIAFVRLADHLEYALRTYAGPDPTAAAEHVATDPSAEYLDIDAKQLAELWSELVRVRLDARGGR